MACWPGRASGIRLGRVLSQDRVPAHEFGAGPGAAGSEGVAGVGGGEADEDACAIMAGAAGYALKQMRGTDLVDGVRRVGRGESLLDPSLTARVLERLRQPAEPDALAGLTDQERRVLDLIAKGMTNRQIGEHLFLAEKTVKNYFSNLLSKLGMSRRTEAAAYAARLAERRQNDHPGA